MVQSVGPCHANPTDNPEEASGSLSLEAFLFSSFSFKMSVRSISNSQREEAVKVEDVEHAEDSDVEDAAEGASENSRQSKSEKKSRKAMLKLGMKPISITSLSRVTIKRTKNVAAYTDTQAAQQFRMPDFGSVMAKSDISAAVAGAQGDEEPRDI
ncbi:hypothetical protein RHSIM_Rhsim09G0210300 [Rhododendron simsii]|uniref:NAC-A/B domain-containing protein n=1 Tax=Rhododendron simsii TaxID=118357 RepID=A0A834LE95_RHOSS|nr:hypothetical protein RHSIM_Rhsim09G0210300 [Rhododendron simsii]